MTVSSGSLGSDDVQHLHQKKADKFQNLSASGLDEIKHETDFTAVFKKVAESLLVDGTDITTNREAEAIVHDAFKPHTDDTAVSHNHFAKTLRDTVLENNLKIRLNLPGAQTPEQLYQQLATMIQQKMRVGM